MEEKQYFRKKIGKNGGKLALKYDTNRLCYSYEYRGKDYANKEHKTIVIHNEDEVDLFEFKNELIDLKKNYYLTIIIGVAFCSSKCESMIKNLGIRTEILYFKNGSQVFKKASYDDSDIEDSHHDKNKKQY